MPEISVYLNANSVKKSSKKAKFPQHFSKDLRYMTSKKEICDVTLNAKVNLSICCV